MKYEKEIGDIQKKTYSQLICNYCGFEVMSLTRSAICQFCEAYISGRAKESIEVLTTIQDLIKQNKISKAKQSVDELGKSADPRILYGAAGFYKFFSDLSYYDLDYNRKGFMEENSSNIYESMHLISKFKEMLFKMIKIAETHDPKSDPVLSYLLFISNIKLKRIVEANKYLIYVKLNSQSDLMLKYALMVHDVETGSKNAYSSMYGLMKDYNLNAYYYLALYYANNKKMKEAREVLKVLLIKTWMPKASFLLRKVENLIEETRL